MSSQRQYAKQLTQMASMADSGNKRLDNAKEIITAWCTKGESKNLLLSLAFKVKPHVNMELERMKALFKKVLELQILVISGGPKLVEDWFDLRKNIQGDQAADDANAPEWQTKLNAIEDKLSKIQKLYEEFLEDELGQCMEISAGLEGDETDTLIEHLRAMSLISPAMNVAPDVQAEHVLPPPQPIPCKTPQSPLKVDISLHRRKWDELGESFEQPCNDWLVKIQEVMKEVYLQEWRNPPIASQQVSNTFKISAIFFNDKREKLIILLIKKYVEALESGINVKGFLLYVIDSISEKDAQNPEELRVIINSTKTLHAKAGKDLDARLSTLDDWLWQLGQVVVLLDQCTQAFLPDFVQEIKWLGLPWTRAECLNPGYLLNEVLLYQKLRREEKNITDSLSYALWRDVMTKFSRNDCARFINFYVKTNEFKEAHLKFNSLQNLIHCITRFASEHQNWPTQVKDSQKLQQKSAPVAVAFKSAVASKPVVRTEERVNRDFEALVRLDDNKIEVGPKPRTIWAPKVDKGEMAHSSTLSDEAKKHLLRHFSGDPVEQKDAFWKSHCGTCAAPGHDASKCNHRYYALVWYVANAAAEKKNA